MHNTSAKYWWKLDEAAILPPFKALAMRETLDLSINLPSHAMDNVPVPPFKIQRRSRQDHYVMENRPLPEPLAQWKPQFDMLQVMVGMQEGSEGTAEVIEAEGA